MGILSFLAVLFLTAFTLVLTAVTFVTTVRFELYSEADLPRFHIESIPLLLVCIALWILLLILIRTRTRFTSDREVSPRPVSLPGGRVTVIVLSVIGIFSLSLILGVHGMATTDALTLDGIINDFMKGDHSSLTTPGGYLFIYPFQLGYVALGQLLYLMGSPSCYPAYQLINLVSVIITLVFLYLITDGLFPGGGTAETAVLLSCGLLCLYVHSTFIYSDIWSLAPQSAALYMMMLAFRHHRMRFYILAGIFTGFAVILKHNCYILLAAILMTVILRAVFMDHLRSKLLSCLTGAVILVITLAFPRAVDLSYSLLPDIDAIPDGVPASTYLAMGLQEAETSNGWYNGFTVHTYKDAGYDHEEASRLGWKEVGRRVDTFMHHPRYTLKFFAGKTFSQWADPSFASMRELELTSRHTGDHIPVIDSIIYGKGRSILIFLMDVCQSLMYTGFAVYLTALVRSGRLTRDRGRFFIDEHSGETMILIFLIGGIIFHTFWEASSRYILRYYICILPFAASGWKNITDRILSGKLLSKVKGHTDISKDSKR